MMLFAFMALIAGTVLPLAHKQAMLHRRRRRPAEASWTRAVIQWPYTISRLWVTSQLLFAACMLSTSLVLSLEGACVLVGLSGMSWAITIWAPYAVISAHVSDAGEEAAKAAPGLLVVAIQEFSTLR